MPSPFANFPVLFEKQDAKNNDYCSQVQAKRANQVNYLYVWIAILVVPIIYNGHLSWKLLTQRNEQQIQLEHLFNRVHNLTILVDHLVYRQQVHSNSQNDRPARAKRHIFQRDSIATKNEDFQIGRAFRWIESNWTDRVGSAGKRRRQVESLTDIDDSEPDDKQPAVDFFQRPQSVSGPNNGYEWLTSYCRIRVCVFILTLYTYKYT